MFAGQLTVFLLLCLIYPSLQWGETTNFTNVKPLNLYTINCTRDIDCTPNSYCHFRKCVCKDQYIPDRDIASGIVKCIKEAVDIDDYCEKDIQCAARLGTHAACRKDDKASIGKCSCADDSHYVENQCYKSAYIGHACQVNSHCVIRNKNLKAYCLYGQCTCPPHHHAIDHGKDCVITSELSGPCDSTDSCITLNSECMHGACKCKTNFIPDFENKSCLFVSEKVGDPCVEDKQCSLKVAHSKCDARKGICLCHDGYHQNELKCWHTAHLLDPCENLNECRRDDHADRGIVCKENICQCKYGYYIEENKFCLKMANYTEEDPNCGLTTNISSYLVFVTLMILTMQAIIF